MAITKKELKKLADLARLTFSDVQMNEMKDDVDSILGLIDKLTLVDVSGIWVDVALFPHIDHSAHMRTWTNQSNAPLLNNVEHLKEENAIVVGTKY